jgi:hypothetical protein
MASDFLSEEDFAPKSPQISQGRDFLEDDFPEESSNNLASYDQLKSQLTPKAKNFAKSSDIILDMIYGFGKSGANIAKLINKNAPDMPDIRSKNSDPLAVNIGQGLPFAAGGASLLGAIGGGAAYGATQYDPGQQGIIDKKLGIPTNRLTNTIEDAALGGLFRAIPALAPVTKKSIINNIWKTHDALENRAAAGFKQVSKEATNRGIDKVPMEKQNFNIEDLKEYFPNTKASAQLLSNAQTGDYNALRKVQSDLYTRGKKNLQSDFEAERDRGEEMLDRRNDVNQGISEHLKNTGNSDLSDILDSSRKDWKTLQDVYYNRNLSNSVAKLVDEDIRKVPKNLTDILQEDSKPMQKFRNFHPGLENAVKKHLLQKKAITGLGWGSAGLYGGNMLYNELLGKKSP